MMPVLPRRRIITNDIETIACMLERRMRSHYGDYPRKRMLVSLRRRVRRVEATKSAPG
jgi:hypothetical protein